MRLQEIIETFGDVLHVGRAESAIYVQLSVAGPTKVGELAGVLKLHRNEVYRCASRLLQRGFIEMTIERPARYAAVPLDRIVESQLAGHRADMEHLARARDELAPLLLRLQAPEGAPPKSTYKIIQGRSEVYSVRNRLLHEARERLDWISTTPASLSLADVSGALDTLTERVRDGLRFRGLFRLPEGEAACLEPLRQFENAQVRRTDLESAVQFLIADNRELLMWVVHDPSTALHARDEVGMQTTASGFLQAERLFFEQLFARASAEAVTSDG